MFFFRLMIFLAYILHSYSLSASLSDEKCFESIKKNQLTAKYGSGLETEPLVTESFLNNLTTTSDGTLKFLVEYISDKYLPNISEKLGLLPEESLRQILWKDVEASEKLYILERVIESSSEETLSEGIPGLQLVTKFHFDSSDDFQFFHINVPKGPSILDLSELLDSRIWLASEERPLPLRYVELHLQSSELAGDSLEDLTTLENLLQLQSSSHHVHMITSKPPVTSEMALSDKLLRTTHLVELIRIGNMALEFIAVLIGKDSLGIYYDVNNDKNSKTIYAGIYTREAYRLIFNTLIESKEANIEVIGPLKLGSLAYRPPGKYIDKSVHGLEARIVTKDTLPVAILVLNEIHSAFNRLSALDFSAKVFTPTYYLQDWLNCQLESNEKFNSTDYLKVSIFPTEWFEMIDALIEPLKKYKKAQQIIKKLTHDRIGTLTSNRQLLWLLHDWSKDPSIELRSKEEKIRILNAQVSALEAIESGEDPLIITRVFGINSGLLEHFYELLTPK